ncbi:MAG: hypothetical protein V2J65_28935 [Desulfobacteraceae bacterium]|jgi:hypothetical protein|nr:hypothetical protein [Desulfobacteraceae bacterium]
MIKKEIEKTKKNIIRDDDYCIKTKKYSAVIPAVIRIWVSNSISFNNKPK